jgi:S1-C subfamily serine protease
LAVAALVLVIAACGETGGDGDAAAAAVVTIEASGCRLRPVQAVGTVVGDELVVTVAHAVAGESEITVRTRDGQERSAVVAAIDTGLDAAVLRVAGLDVVALRRREYRDDDEVSLMLGGEPQRAEVRRRVMLRTSDIYRQGEHERPGLEVEARIRAGDSGGGLVTNDGSLIGFVWSRSREADDRAWATRIEAVAPLVDAARRGASSPAAECSR